ncbi:MAG: mechanosensitive ion channel domain-containing protein [Victivallaceae bacterium]
MKKFRIGLVWLALLTVLALGAAEPVKVEIEDSESDRWTIILSRWESELSRSLQILRDYRMMLENTTDNFDRLEADTDRQIEALKFMLSFCLPQDVFEVTLRCQEIDELNSRYIREYQRIEKLRHTISVLQGHARRLQNELLSQSSTRFSEKQMLQLQQCLINCEQLETQLARLDRKLASYEKNPIRQRLEALLEESNRYRVKALDEVFFSAQRDYFTSLPASYGSLRFWWLTMFDRLLLARDVKMAVPLRNCAIVFLAVFLFAFIVGPRYLYPWLVRQVKFPDKYSKSRTFVIAWMLLALVATMLICRQNLPGLFKAPLFQLAQCFCGTAFLMLSLAFRLDRPMMRRCMWLYIPLLIQNLVAALLYMMLTSYTPLLLLVVPFNVIIFILTLLLLRRGGYPVLDTVIGYITLAVIAVETYFALVGYLYIGFTMMLIGYVMLAQVQTAVAASEVIIRGVRAKPDRLIVNTVLTRLIIPLLWLWLLRNCFKMVAVTYHIEDFMEEISVRPLQLNDVMRFSLTALLTAILSFLAINFLIALAKQTVEKVYQESAQSGKVPSFVTLGTYIAWGVYVVFLLLLFNVQYSSILVVLGGLSVGFGFALKELLENFISGIILLVGQQVRPGDEIEFDGTYAKVRKVSFRATMIETFDGSTITLPNSQVLSKDFRNWTRHDRRMRRDIAVGVSYRENPDRVRELLLRAAAETRGVHNSPMPEVYCLNFGASSVDFVLRVWLTIGQQNTVCSALRESIFRLFNENGIEIPFSQLDIHIRNSTDAVPVQLLSPESH